MNPDLDPYSLDRAALRAGFDRAAPTYDAAAALQSEVRARLLERLAVLQIAPRLAVDLGAGTGHAAAALAARYRGARILAIDLAPGMLQQAARQSRWRKRFSRVCADAASLPLPDGSVDLLFSNLMVNYCADFGAVFAECRRVLRPDGVLSFTAYGPDTLGLLRAAWAEVDDRPHVHRFADMHDVGDALLRAGLREPVLDVEYLTVTYGDLHTLMRELKAQGVHNVLHGRDRGLTGRGRLAALLRAADGRRENGRLPLHYEIVYGQAWGAAERGKPLDTPGIARVPVSAIRRRGAAPDP